MWICYAHVSIPFLHVVVFEGFLQPTVAMSSQWWRERVPSSRNMTPFSLFSSYRRKNRNLPYPPSGCKSHHSVYRGCRFLRNELSASFIGHTVDGSAVQPRDLSGVYAKLRIAAVSSCPSACPSVRIKQLGSHWTDFHEIWYLIIFRNYVEKIQFSLKCDNNNVYFTWRRMYIYDSTSVRCS
jgi:hypothetical protein